MAAILRLVVSLAISLAFGIHFAQKEKLQQNHFTYVISYFCSKARSYLMILTLPKTLKG